MKIKALALPLLFHYEKGFLNPLPLSLRTILIKTSLIKIYRPTLIKTPGVNLIKDQISLIILDGD